MLKSCLKSSTMSNRCVIKSNMFKGGMLQFKTENLTLRKRCQGIAETKKFGGQKKSTKNNNKLLRKMYALFQGEESMTCRADEIHNLTHLKTLRK